MRPAYTSKALGGAALLFFALACQEATVTNTNTTTTNTAVNVNGSNANMTTTTMTTGAGTTIEAKEPDKYSATMLATVATAGQQPMKGQVEIKVARNGADRRYAATVPVLGEIIFLDKADKRYLIMPARKQYAELTQELTGINTDQMRAMTPGQLVAFVQARQGVERVGEETLNNRQAVKYRVAGRAQTQTTAGQVQGESFIYVDKETGLPLRIEGFGQSSGNVQGVSGGNVTVETRELKTDVNPADFEIPEGLRKLTPEEARQQVAQITQGIQMLLAFLSAQQQQGAAAAATPAAGASPAASPGR
ncbi:MAG TPA: hypothetical protein VK422_21785 [Pyrinomonadaceae bacterium]|nr:hypothetical protein [Pyrinomonadaceae bacterium]